MKKLLLLVVLVVFVNGCDDGETTYADYKDLDLLVIPSDILSNRNSFCGYTFRHLNNKSNKTILHIPLEFEPSFPKGANDTIESRILHCINDKKVIQDKCDNSVNDLLFESKSTQKKCLKKLNKYEAKEKKEYDKMVEKCIEKANEMQTESAYKDMLLNCIKQNSAN